MKTNRIYALVIMAIVAVTFAGCSSNSSNSGTAARTQVTTGAITGFGSVFVNGIEFSQKAGVTDAQAVTFKFDDSHPGPAGLKKGMIVRVSGNVDPTTNKGEFESIEFAPELRGPAANVQVVSGNTGTLTIMGHEVATSATTSIEGAADMAALQSKLAGGNHPELEVSGRMDNAGVFHATRIAVKADNFVAGGKCEIHGKIASSPTPSAGGFTIGDIAVVISGPEVLSNLTTTGITAGAMVEVKGNLSGNSLTATRIEGNHGNHGVGEGVEVEDHVSIQGIATGVIAPDGSFTMNGPNGTVNVKVDGTTDMGGAAPSSVITANATLEVEGTLQADGSVLAFKIKSETEIESEAESHSGGGEVGGGGGGGGDTSGK